MNFAIFAPSYDPNNGGAVVLHALADRLNELGYRAAVHPWSLRDYRKYAKQSWRRALFEAVVIRRLSFKTGPFEGILRRRHDPETIAIYPEIVTGNPLNLARCVRWILYKPGAHFGEVDFGARDLLVFYSMDFAPEAQREAAQLLRITHLNPAYVQTNFGPREGSCVMFRKGRGRDLTQHPDDALVVDGLSHAELARVFNKAERFYCYDLYTYYTVYAALCGCIPVVIPVAGTTEQDWVKREEERLGVAYGEDKLDWAVATRPLLLEHLQRKRDEEDQMVRAFVCSCQEHFEAASRSSQGA